MVAHGTGWHVWALFALAIGWVGPALAQDEATLEEARLAFEAGREAFAVGRYRAALEQFERVYALTEHPDVLYNIGHTADRIRHDERALSAFEAYLEARPDAEERSAIEARIATLRQAIAERASREAAMEAVEAEPEPPAAIPQATPPPPPARPATETAIPGWILVGVGAASAIGGVALLGAARVEADRVSNANPGTPWLDVAGAHAAADDYAIAGGVLLGVGVAAAAVGAVLVAIDDPGGVDVAVGPGALRVRGAF